MSGRIMIDSDALRRAGVRRAMHVVEAAAIIARDEVVLTMEPGPPRTGNIYKVPGTDTTYTASAPGQPPAVREGIYRDSIQNSPAVQVGDAVHASAFSALKTETGHVLGALLEFGTVKMKPRPHWRPGYENARVRIAELVEQVNAGNA